MPQQPGKGKRELTAEQWAEYDRLASEKLSQTQIAKRLGLPQARLSRRLAERAQITPNGTPHEAEPSPTDHTTETFRRNVPATPSTPDAPVHPRSTKGAPTTLQTIEMVGEPVWSTESAPLIHDIATRLDVAEAFIATLQRQMTLLIGSPAGVPEVHPPSPETLKRGFVIARDLSERIDAYATAHHLQVKQVLDMALRRFFAAQEGASHG